MKNFNYDGQYPGFVNGEWIVDERDGHSWLNIPGVTILENFPAEYSVHFMENPKEYGNPNINLHDEVFSIPSFKFDNVLKRTKPKLNQQDYYEVIVGQEMLIDLPSNIPPGVTIGSILLRDKATGRFVNVINLRSIVAFDLVRGINLKFGVGLRIAQYGLVTFTNIDLGNNRRITFDSFYIESPKSVWEAGKTVYSSPEDYLAFSNQQPTNDSWFENYCQIPKYSEDMLKGPDAKHVSKPNEMSTMQLKGTFELIRGFTGIKSIKMPFCPGVSLVVRITEFNDNGTVTPYLNLTTEKYVNFNFITRMIEVSR